jgi:hypothetical protein
MRRHDTHSSDAAAGTHTHARRLPASLQTQAGNRAVAGVLEPRSVQRSPRSHPDDRDYWSEKGPKQLDSHFKPAAGEQAPPSDAGFVPPSQKSKDGLDLGYGGTGDGTFQADVHNDGGAHTAGLAEALDAHHGFGHPYQQQDLPIPAVGLPVPGGDDSGWFDGLSGTIPGALSGSASDPLAGAAWAGGEVAESAAASPAADASSWDIPGTPFKSW